MKICVAIRWRKRKSCWRSPSLAWAEETGNFIERSTRSSGRERYFSLFRNPMEAATKWKRELSADEIAHFTGIVEQVLPAGLVW